MLARGAHRDTLTAQIARLAAVPAVRSSHAGLAPRDPVSRAPLDAAGLAAAEARLGAEAAAETRRGLAWFAAAQAALAMALAGLVALAVSDARLHARLDMERLLTFLVQGPAPVACLLGLAPRYSAVGRIIEPGEAATPALTRSQWRAARRGARLMVFAVGGSDGSKASVADVARSRPLARVAGVGVFAMGVAAAAFATGWLGWLGRTAARPGRLLDRFLEAGLAAFKLSAAGAVGLAAALAARRWLG